MTWLDHSLLYGPKFCLVTSQKEFERVCKRNGLPDQGDRYVREGCNATTHWWHDNAVGVVAIDLDAVKDMTPISVAALLTHEAVHVWQHAERIIGGVACDEMEAYAVQNISARLMEAYAERLK